MDNYDYDVMYYVLHGFDHSFIEFHTVTHSVLSFILTE